MKTIIIIALSFFVAGSTFAQLNRTSGKNVKQQKNTREIVLLEEGFEGSTAIPAGWTIIDQDGDGFNWEVKDDTAWHIPHSGYNVIVSESFNNGPLSPENYLITPAMDLSGTSGSFFVSWWVMSYDQLAYFAEHYKVAVSTTGTNPEDFTDVVFEETMTAAGEYESRIADLSAYSGQTIYIAFVHYNCSDQFKLMIDDIKVFGAYNIDAGMAAITTLPFGNTIEPIYISGSVVNAGVDPLTSYDVVYTIDGGAQSTVYPVSGINIPTGEFHDFVHNTPYQFTSDGTYEIQVEITNVNQGTDQDLTNNINTKSIDINANYRERIILHEVFTSSTCSPCIFANLFIDNVLGKPENQGKFTLIKHQCNWPAPGDPYYNLDVATRIFYYGVDAIPHFYIDAQEEGVSYQQSTFDLYRNTPSFFTIMASHIITGSNVSVNVTISPNMDFTGTCHIAVVEKVTTGNVGTNGETEFHNVLMKMLPDANGTSVELTQGNNFSFSESYDMSSTFVEEMDDLEVIVFLQADDKEVMQSANSSIITGIGDNPGDIGITLFPNPTTGIIHFRNVENSHVTVYNILGEAVVNCEVSLANESIDLSGQPDGTYFVQVQTENNVNVKKVILRR